MTTTQYAFLLDLARCVGCQGCVAACKTGNELPEKVKFIRIEELTLGAFPDVTSYVKNHRCFHCTDAACVAECPTGALYKEDGMTRLNTEACIGCGRCVKSCPFEVPKLIKKKSVKCDGCAETVKAGGIPWCVKTCPSDALRYADREEILAEAHARVEAIKGRYPNAQVYGETQAGGLNVIVVVPDDPEIWELPLDPETAAAGRMAQAAPLPPVRAGLGVFGVLTVGLAAAIGRRNRLHSERAEAEARAGAGQE